MYLSNVKTTVTENSKRTEINQKEIELLKLQIKEIQLKSGNTFKLIWQEMMYKVLVEVEGIKKDIENANVIHSRLDTKKLDKLTDVSTSIKSMLIRS